MLQHSMSLNCPLPLVDGWGVMELAQVDREGSWWQELVWLYSGSSSWSVVVVMGMMDRFFFPVPSMVAVWRCASFKKNAKIVDIFIDA